MHPHWPLRGALQEGKRLLTDAVSKARPKDCNVYPAEGFLLAGKNTYMDLMYNKQISRSNKTKTLKKK